MNRQIYFHEDSTEAVAETRKIRKAQKNDDVFATQTLICVLVATATVALNLINPELCGELSAIFTKLISDTRELFPNPIEGLLNK